MKAETSSVRPWKKTQHSQELTWWVRIQAYCGHTLQALQDNGMSYDIIKKVQAGVMRNISLSDELVNKSKELTQMYCLLFCVNF